MLLTLMMASFGGWWIVREKVARMPLGLRRRILLALYTNYLEARGSYIAVGATFETPPIFPHGPIGVFIAPQAVFGSGVKIFQQVTIGVSGAIGSDNQGAPTIGDGVFIGAGAKVIGQIIIGAEATIGAGAIVVDDVPARALAVSPKAVVITRHL